MDSGGQGGTRAGQRGGSSSVTPGQGQAKGAAATATAPPATATATGGARGSRQGAPTAAAAPTKKRNADWPRYLHTSRTDWLRLPPRPAPSAEPGLTDRRGRADEGAEPAAGGGAWAGRPRSAGVKPRWPAGGGGVGWGSCCLCQDKERAGDNGRAGRRERRGLILTGFVGGAPCPAAEEGMGFWHGNAALLEGSKANS